MPRKGLSEEESYELMMREMRLNRFIRRTIKVLVVLSVIALLSGILYFLSIIF